MFLALLSNRRKRAERRNLFRNFIFGVEDSLVSTVGLLSGVATASAPTSSIISTGIILIFVEAFSMGVGSFLSEDNAARSDHSSRTHARIARGALVMFASYFLAGFIPLSPYLLMAPGRAITASISLTLISLTILGLISARHNHNNYVRSALEMLVVGGLATLIGVGVGNVLMLQS
jgi:VIT1/CCC1 family predicted Fe2+/Mn2+ transporter